MVYRPQKVVVNLVDADILVIGGGLAGLMSAIEAARAAKKVVVVTKGLAGRSGNTIMARNGMAAVLEEGYDGDSINQHFEDTVKAGQSINNLAMVKVFSARADAAINRLVELGVPFLEANGALLRKGSPGHSRKRFITMDGRSVKSPKTQGLVLTLPLAREALRLGVRHVEGVLVTSLLVADGRVTGALGIDRKAEVIRVFRATAVILACGGAGGLYPVTTNLADVTGDGYALAQNAGARLKDMEFVQFHPAVALGKPGMVMSTAPFANGAVLRNSLGERYMARYSPQMEMATRDIMARANFTEINEGRGTPGGGVYMDFAPMPASDLQTKYSDLYKYLGGRTVLEVAPAMHYMMGGVEVDESCRTNIAGLYAAGESAGGLHGANRLAGNALSEAAVFGMIAGKQAALECEACEHRNDVDVDVNGLLEQFFSAGGQARPNEICMTPGEIRKSLRQTMGAKVGLIRRGADLQDAVEEFKRLKERTFCASFSDWREFYEHRQVMLMVDTAAEIAKAALAREKSLGAHFRLDD